MSKQVGNVEILRMRDGTLRVNIFVGGKWVNDVTGRDTYVNRDALASVARQANCAYCMTRRD